MKRAVGSSTRDPRKQTSPTVALLPLCSNDLAFTTKGDEVMDDANDAPIDGAQWGKWNREAASRWEVVGRSWGVFQRNTTELVNLLKGPAKNLALSFALFGDHSEATARFWAELDQRLHNQLAGAVTLVDHTRRLTDYYAEDAPALVEEFERLNAEVVAMDETAFLRRLRNYLLHYGAAPVVQTQSLSISEGGMTGHSIKLEAEHLLRWDGWSAQAKQYLANFPERDGPVIGIVVVAYANAMSQMYSWLFKQRDEVMRTPPHRFRMTAPLDQ